MKNEFVSRRMAVLGAGRALGVGLAAGALSLSVRAQAQSSADEIGVLKALLTAERNAIKTYEAGKGVLDAASVSDGLYAFKGLITAIALHFRQQHLDHAAKIVEYITAQGGADDVGAGVAQIPSNFVGNIKNVVDLATNAEKAAAIAYTNVQKQLTVPDNSVLASAIGAVETQHFVVLQLVARGFVVPPSAAQGQSETALAATAAKIAPSSFVVSVKGSPSLADEQALPFYDVTQ
ncbi:MAG: ferritin-like domain-containing protein [Myxococcaceae bacterium]